MPIELSMAPVHSCHTPPPHNYDRTRPTVQDPTMGKRGSAFQQTPPRDEYLRNTTVELAYQVQQTKEPYEVVPHAGLAAPHRVRVTQAGFHAKTYTCHRTCSLLAFQTNDMACSAACHLSSYCKNDFYYYPY